MRAKYRTIRKVCVSRHAESHFGIYRFDANMPEKGDKVGWLDALAAHSLNEKGDTNDMWLYS